jgi:hypothetical protein
LTFSFLPEEQVKAQRANGKAAGKTAIIQENLTLALCDWRFDF